MDSISPWGRKESDTTELLSLSQTVKNLPTKQETWVLSLGGEDPLEKGMANHSSILDLENSMDRGAWWAAVHGGHREWDMTELLIPTHAHPPSLIAEAG